MNRTKYQDGVEVLADQLNFTESSKSTAIKDRKDFVQSGVVSGLRVTKPAGTVSIDVGVGYCANGERIEVLSDITGVVTTPGQYNFITLIYKEVEQKPKPHEKTGTSYTTEVIETYLVEVLSTSAYNSLTQSDRDNRVLVAIEKDGVIQQSYDLYETITSTPIDIHIHGVGLLKFSLDTIDGECWFDFVYVVGGYSKLRYKSMGNSYGSFVTLNGNADYWLYSSSGTYCIVRVKIGFLPKESKEFFVNVYRLYGPPTEGSRFYHTPVGSSKDGYHRDSIGGGLTVDRNAHGETVDDLPGGASDVVVHQRRMHSSRELEGSTYYGTNCIVSKQWFLNRNDDALKPYVSGTSILLKPLPLGDRYYIQGKGHSEVLSSSIEPDPGFQYIAIDDNKNLIQSSSLPDEGYLILCKIFAGGGHLQNFEDLRVFASTSEFEFQEKSVAKNKLDAGCVRKIHLWDGADDSFINILVNGSNADALHTHYDPIEDWMKLYYLKTIMCKPQTPTPNPQCCRDYDGTEWCGCEDAFGADVIGATIDPITCPVAPPNSYKPPGQTLSIEQSFRGIARVSKGDLDSTQEALDYLASLMKVLRDREFPQTTEVMDTSGRMLNLTFVPLPNGHLDGKWIDGEDVKEDECSWIVSPAFLWGLGGTHVPYCLLCTTFGLGTGGDWDPNQTWSWDNWMTLFWQILNGNILYGRWLVYLYIMSATDIITALSTILATHANYHIIGSHQVRLDYNAKYEQPSTKYQAVFSNGLTPSDQSKYKYPDGTSILPDLSGDPKTMSTWEGFYNTTNTQLITREPIEFVAGVAKLKWVNVGQNLALFSLKLENEVGGQFIELLDFTIALLPYYGAQINGTNPLMVGGTEEKPFVAYATYKYIVAQYPWDKTGTQVPTTEDEPQKPYNWPEGKPWPPKGGL